MKLSKPSSEQISDALPDIYYEIHQLVASCESAGARTEAEVNMFVECRLLHLRNLVDFFSTSLEDRFKDDVLAADYGFPLSKSIVTDDLATRLNKDLAHLTYDRQNRRSEINKRWPAQTTVVPMLEVAESYIEYLLGMATLVLTHEQRDSWSLLLTKVRHLHELLQADTRFVYLQSFAETTSGDYKM